MKTKEQDKEFNEICGMKVRDWKSKEDYIKANPHGSFAKKEETQDKLAGDKLT